ncbi:dual specificity protein phosphatase 22 isoform X3 [Trichechus manatus latirostris]|uniref:JNK pathway associated phosphatase n=1 Tax=Trichechus manatus latirostris TaxID=127582 RepID=A0A2Y9RS48_TRIMA|nr:dual specificity protein phosphatase 22 isoform X3 [Trichechus manatus latirostris]
MLKIALGYQISKLCNSERSAWLHDARDAEQLSKNKVTHILSVHDSARPMLEGVKYLCIPAADSPSQNLTRHFKESIQFIHECRLKGEGCLVHCLAGVSRSVTLVTAYIMTITDFGWEDALHTVRAGRSCANPNLGFQRQLQEFEEHKVHQYRQWLKEEYGESPLQDAEEAKTILVNSVSNSQPLWLRSRNGKASIPLSSLMFLIWDPIRMLPASDSWSSEIFGLPQKSVMYLKLLKYWKATVFRPMLPKRT